MPRQPKQFVIYLAGPVDDVSIEETLGWREEAAREFPDVLFYCPPTAFLNSKMSTAKSVDHINRHAIACSAALVANLSGTGRGFGTIREIEFAREHDLYVAVIVDFDDPMRKSLLTHDIHLFETVISAVEGALKFQADNAQNRQLITPFGTLELRSPEDEDGDDE